MKATLTLPASGLGFAAIILTAALTACSAPAGQAGGASAAGPSAVPVTACNTQNLTVVKDLHFVHASGGNTYLPIDFVNSSNTACSLAGYPRVTGASATGQYVRAAVKLGGHPAPVLLKPSYTAHTWVLINHVPASKAAGCKPLHGGAFRVFAPGSAAHAWITYPFTACMTPGRAALGVLPITEGLANPAITP